MGIVQPKRYDHKLGIMIECHGIIIVLRKAMKIVLNLNLGLANA